MESMRVGLRRHVFRIPSPIWRAGVWKSVRDTTERARFLTSEHHRVRDFATLEVARSDRPLPLEAIATAVGLPIERVGTIVEDLETAKTFLYRDDNGDIEWVYPVTAARTGHRVEFSTGEAAAAA